MSTRQGRVCTQYRPRKTNSVAGRFPHPPFSCSCLRVHASTHNTKKKLRGAHTKQKRVVIQNPLVNSVPLYMTGCTVVDTQPCSTSISWFSSKKKKKQGVYTLSIIPKKGGTIHGSVCSGETLLSGRKKGYFIGSFFFFFFFGCLFFLENCICISVGEMWR